MRILGKHAAYAVSLTREIFAEWDAILTNAEQETTEANGSRSSNGGDINQTAKQRDSSVGFMTECGLGCRDIFRRDNPDLFYALYHIPEEGRNDDTWHEHVKDLSHPYDALLMLYLVEPQLFQPVKVAAAGHVCHELVGVGSDPSSVGLVDVESVRAAIKAGVARGLSHWKM